MKLNCIYIVLVLLSLDVNAQVIKGTVTGKVDRLEVYAPLSVGTNSFVMPCNLERNSDESFFYKSPNGRTGYYKVSIDGDYSYYFLQPHDTLVLRIDKHKNTFTIVGPKNWKFMLYREQDRKLMDRFDKLDANLQGSINIKEKNGRNGSITAEYFVRNWRRMLAKDLAEEHKKFESYRQDPHFDSIFYHKSQAMLKLTVYYRYIYAANGIENAFPKYKTELKKLRNEIVIACNPSDTIYHNANTVWHILLTYQIAKELKPKYGIVRDTSWSEFGKGLSFAQYFSPEVQEYYFGHLIENSIYGSGYTEKAERRLAQFRQHFPNSEYVVALESMKDYDVNAVKNSKSYGFLDSLRISSLSELAIQIGNRPFMVDMWATWCPICKREFYELRKLENDLQDRGIALVYICFNPQFAVKGYLQDVGRFNLRGYNLQVDTKSDFGVELNETIFLNGSMSLPHYALFNGKGELLSHDLPSPSTGQKLLDEIDRLLKK